MTVLEAILVIIIIALIAFFLYYFFRGSGGQISISRPMESRQRSRTSSPPRVRRMGLTSGNVAPRKLNDAGTSVYGSRSSESHDAGVVGAKERIEGRVLA